MHVVMLAYPDMTQLDLTGPLEVFTRFKEVTVDLAWKNKAPIKAGTVLEIVPTISFTECPQGDILFVPGGPGQVSLMEDNETLGFLRKQAEHSQYVTSVCTGSLILAAAGLLTGYRATCHWLSLHQLSYFDVEPVSERVVIDRNRVTGAGVTSGIDFALTLSAEIFGEARTRRAQLSMEYDPRPPFPGGSPATSDPATIESLRDLMAPFQRDREAIASRAAKAMRES